MSDKICKMSLELARINNNLNMQGGNRNNTKTYSVIIDPITFKTVSLYSREGQSILKNLISEYKRLTV